MSSIGKNIKFLRNERKMTQDALAERLCVTRQTISNYEVGKSQPDIETLKKLAEIFQVDIYEILYQPVGRTVQRAKYAKILLAFLLAAVLGVILHQMIRRASMIDQGHAQALNILLRLLIAPVYYFLLGWLVSGSIRSLYTTTFLSRSARRLCLLCVAVLAILFVLALFPYYSVMLTVLGVPYIRVPSVWMDITHWITGNQHFVWISLLLGTCCGACTGNKQKAS